MSRSDDLDFFFTEPSVEPDVHGQARGASSVLYLLRREAVDCQLPDPPVDQAKNLDETKVFWATDKRRIFLSFMVIFSGFDLLAKFSSGNDQIGGVGNRYQQFLHEFGNLNPQEAAILWKLRNSIMHSFGLYDPKNQPSTDIGVSDKCWKPLDRNAPAINQTQQGWIVCLDHLYELFLKTIAKYENDVRSGKGDLGKHFDDMLPKYGQISFMRLSP